MKHLPLISLVLASALACGAALAQPGPGQRPDPQARLQNLSILLELDAAQQDKLRVLFERQREQMQAHRGQQRESSNKDREAKRAEHAQQRAAFHNEVAAVLTPTQVQKFEALMAERQAKQPRRREKRGHDGGNG